LNVGTVSALIDLSWNGEYGLYLWTGILIAIILGIAFPLTLYEQRVVKRRWQAVSEFLDKHQREVNFRPHHLKRDGDILVPVFSGFLIHGHFAYICLDAAQDRQKALSFIRNLREFCLAHNSWHFDYFTSRFYAWHYYNKARRAFGGA
jgi:hypothetical protein